MKTVVIKDSYGDTLAVSEDAGTTRVYVEAEFTLRNELRFADYSFTPKKARRLAKALRKAAKRAER